MSDIIRTILKQDDFPDIVIGDIWVKTDPHNRDKKYIVKIKEIKETPHRIDIFYFTFKQGQWIQWDQDYHNNSELEYFKRDFVKFEGDFEKTHQYALSILNQEEPMPDPIETPVVDSMGLMGTASKEYMLVVQNNILAAKTRYEMINSALKAEIQSRMDDMESMLRRANSNMQVILNQAKEIARIIDTFELYLGVYEDIVVIKEGTSASPDTPISFRQTVLFMDEEIALTHYDADFKNLSDFDKWVCENYSQLVPEDRCVVALKPRRSEKKYFNDGYFNWIMNQDNNKTYLLIRNGENLYRIYSNLCLGNYLFPQKSELEWIQKKMESSSDWDKERGKSSLDMYQRLAFVLQGLIDRTEVFQPTQPGIKIFEMDKWGHLVNFIYDGEDVLPSGRLPFREFQKQAQKQIQEGSRIIFVAEKEYRADYSYRFFKYYRNKWNMPNYPPSGCYSIISYNGELCFSYIPSDTKTVWTWNNGGEYIDKKRERGAYFKLMEYDNILNLDTITLDDIDFYLHNRTDRSNYHDMIPILLETKKMLEKEVEEEKDFVTLVASEAKKSPEEAWEAMKWWKTKNKWKRGLKVDDAKAFRMIKKYLQDGKDK